MPVLEDTTPALGTARPAGLAWWQAGLSGVVTAAVANVVIYATSRGVGASFEFVDGDTQAALSAMHVTVAAGVVFALEAYRPRRVTQPSPA